MKPDDRSLRSGQDGAPREVSLDLVVERDRRADTAGSVASRTADLERAVERAARALAGELHQTEIAHREELGARAVLLELFQERRRECLPVLALLHVDEIDDDDAGEVPE